MVKKEIKLFFQLTEHDFVGRFSVHVSLVKRAIEQFGVSTTAVNVLFMFDCELNNERFILSRHGLEFRG